MSDVMERAKRVGQIAQTHLDAIMQEIDVIDTDSEGQKLSNVMTVLVTMASELAIAIGEIGIEPMETVEALALQMRVMTGDMSKIVRTRDDKPAPAEH